MPLSAAAVADDNLPVIACFSVQAHADPGVMPRVLELFAKRGLVPSSFQSSTTGTDQPHLRSTFRCVVSGARLRTTSPPVYVRSLLSRSC